MNPIKRSDAFKHTMKRGTYCTSKEQEATFGRKRHSGGAALTGGKEFDEIDFKSER